MPLRLEPVPDDARGAHLDLLLLADASEPAVRGYLHAGTLLAARDDAGRRVGVALVVDAGADAVEVRNLAVAPDAQGQGHGRAILDAVSVAAAARGARRVIVGTANSSIGNLAFYQKCGFRIVGVRRGFFDAYPEPLWEHGIRARDMIMLEREL